MVTAPNVPVGSGTRTAGGIRYDRAYDDRMVRALVNPLGTTMTHQNVIKAISVILVCGWLPFQIASAAEPNVASAATAQAADAVAPAPVATPPTPASEAAQTLAAAPSTPNPDDEIICKKIEVFGSRVRKSKLCRTRKEWKLEAQAAKDFTKGIDKGTSAQPGGEALPTGG